MPVFGGRQPNISNDSTVGIPTLSPSGISLIFGILITIFRLIMTLLKIFTGFPSQTQSWYFQQGVLHGLTSHTDLALTPATWISYHASFLRPAPWNPIVRVKIPQKIKIKYSLPRFYLECQFLKLSNSKVNMRWFAICRILKNKFQWTVSKSPMWTSCLRNLKESEGQLGTNLHSLRLSGQMMLECSPWISCGP